MWSKRMGKARVKRALYINCSTVLTEEAREAIREQLTNKSWSTAERVGFILDDVSVLSGQPSWHWANLKHILIHSLYQ